jgi:hypothetical protein
MAFIKIILIAVAIAGAALVSFYVWRNQNTPYNTSPNNISMAKTPYVNTAYGYQLQYPAGWDIKQENVLAQDASAVDLQKAQYISISSESVKVAISVYKNSQHLLVKEYYDQLLSQRSYTAGSLSEANKKMISSTVGGGQALQEKVISPQGQTLSLNFYIQKDEFIYTVSIVSKNSSALSEEDIDQAQSIIDSITF